MGNICSKYKPSNVRKLFRNLQEKNLDENLIKIGNIRGKSEKKFKENLI